jgi:hypothetical protein
VYVTAGLIDSLGFGVSHPESVNAKTIAMISEKNVVIIVFFISISSIL